MHELSVCQSLIKEVENVSRAHGGRRIAEIILSIGPLSGVEPKLLERAFSIARNGTSAEDSRLLTEISPVVVWCGKCQAETETQANALLCGNCGDWQVELKSGNELLLKRVILAGPPAEPAPL